MVVAVREVALILQWLTPSTALRGTIRIAERPTMRWQMKTRFQAAGFHWNWWNGGQWADAVFLMREVVAE